MTDKLIYRKATIEDIPELSALRKAQLADEKIPPTREIDEELVQYFEKHLSDGTLVEWVAEDSGRIIATSAIAFFEFPPTYALIRGMRGYITNMYTAPEYRGRGIATALLDRLVEEAKAHDVKRIWLGASEMGKPVYEKYGFTHEIEWLDLDL